MVHDALIRQLSAEITTLVSAIQYTNKTIEDIVQSCKNICEKADVLRQHHVHTLNTVLITLHLSKDDFKALLHALKDVGIYVMCMGVDRQTYKLHINTVRTAEAWKYIY